MGWDLREGAPAVETTARSGLPDPVLYIFGLEAVRILVSSQLET
jgi:hypothetical protein